MKNSRKKDSTMTEIAKRAGLYQLTCPKCGNRIRAFDALRAFFRLIVKECRSGGRVKVRGFGVFSRKIWKGREIQGVKRPDSRILTFSQSGVTRALMNQKGR